MPGGSICSMAHCNNYKLQKNARSFFRFPKDLHVCKEWVQKCKRSDVDDVFRSKGPDHMYKSYCICSDHFKESDFNNPKLFSQGLKKGTIPTLNLPCAARETCQRRSPKKRAVSPSPENENVDLPTAQSHDESTLPKVKRKKLEKTEDVKTLMQKLKNAQKLVSKQKKIIKELREVVSRLRRNEKKRNISKKNVNSTDEVANQVKYIYLAG